MASEIVVAIIGGGAGLATGVIGSLAAPWANWGIEKQRLRRASRVERVNEWRRGVTYLRKAERENGQPQRVMKGQWYEQSLNVRPEYATVTPDPDLAKVSTKAWFRTLKREASSKALQDLENLTAKPLTERIGQVPNCLDEEINRIERDKWKLT